MMMIIGHDDGWMGHHAAWGIDEIRRLEDRECFHKVLSQPYYRW